MIRNLGHFAYLSSPHFGRGTDGAPKLQEMSLSHIQNYYSMEYRHSPSA